MDKIVDAQFHRVEKALNTLIASISTYNPTPAHASDLYTADQDLARTLGDLATHQKNHARLALLRQTSSSLDTQIKDSIQLLVDVRTELLSTPATVFLSDANPVSYSDLLEYARRISKFTRPITFREDAEEMTLGAEEAGAGSRDKSRTGTPLADSGDLSNGNVNGGENTPVQEGKNSVALPPAVADWINPALTTPAFVPWPAEQVIRRGALASIQVLIDQGVDPATFDPERSMELEAERLRLEEEAVRKAEIEEAERSARREAERAALRVEGGEQRVAAQQPRVFRGLDLLDDDDDD